MSSLPFVPNAEKIVAALQGDIGISRALHAAMVSKNMAKIKDEKQKKQFAGLSKIQGKTGFLSMEMTSISTMMENYKPLIEVALALLALLGGAEVFAGKAFTGKNPFGDPNSFASGILGAQSALADLRKKGLAKPEDKPARSLPEIVLVGVFDRQGKPVEPTSAEMLNSYYAGEWPLVQSIDDHRRSRAAALNSSLAKLEPSDRSEIIQSSLGSIQDEWDYMTKEGALYKARAIYETTLGNLPTPLVPALRGWLAPKTIKDAEGEVELDLEEDYSIEVFYSKTYKRHVVHALLKPELRAQAAAPGSPARKKRPSTANYTPNPLKAAILLAKMVLPAITGKLLPAIQEIIAMIKNPANFLMTLVMTKLKTYFEWLDPSILTFLDPAKAKAFAAATAAGKAFRAAMTAAKLAKALKDGGDAAACALKCANIKMLAARAEAVRDAAALKLASLGSKYVSNGRFLLDGVASIELLGFVLTIGLKNAVPFVRTTPMQPGEKEQPTLKAILDLVKMPIKILVGIVKAFMDLIKKLFNPVTVIPAITNFITFKWLRDLLSADGIMALFGGIPGVPHSMPLFKSAAFPLSVLKGLPFKVPATPDCVCLDDTALEIAAKKRAAEFAAMAAKTLLAGLSPIPQVVKAMLDMVAGILNAVVAMPMDILNVPKSIRDAIPKIEFPDVTLPVPKL